MLKRLPVLLLVLMATGGTVLAAKKTARVAPEIGAEVSPSMVRVELIILGTSKDYHKLEAEAKRVAKKAHVPFYMEGMIYDKKKGLVCKDDPVWAGEYLCRRDASIEIKGKESGFVSIERSEGYPGMKEGYYIIVADVCFSAKEGKAALKRYQKVVPDAYACATSVYIGCRH